MSNLKIGVSMLYCLGNPFKHMLKSISNMDVKYVEIVDDGWHELDKRRVASLNEIRTSFGLKFSVHAPFSDINIASLCKPLLNAMLKRLEKSMRNARELDAYIWVFHPGIGTGISPFYPDADWQQNTKTLKILLRLAGEYGLKIAIENVPEPYPFLMKSVNDFSRFYNDVGESVEMVLDVGHSNISGQTERFLSTFGDRIAHMHLSDNDGMSDQHLGIGCGSVDWHRFAAEVKKAQFDGVLVVEAIENVKQSPSRLEEYLS